MSASGTTDAPSTGPPPQEGIRSFGQIRGFDGIRGVGVLIVFVSHMEVILPLPTLLVIPGGTVSLDMFFVLSGFLITALLLREQARYGMIGRLAFYRRRVLRLLPALIVVVIAAGLAAWAFGYWDSRDWPSIFSVSFYYSNYYVARSPDFWCANLAPGYQAMWSMSFEEQFYMVWPWITIFLLTIRIRLRTVVIVLVGLIAVVSIHRAISYHGVQSWCYLFHATDSRADSILWGALLAHLWVRRREPTRGVAAAGWIGLAVLLVLMPTTTLFGPFLYRGGFILIDVACAAIVLAVLDSSWKGGWLFQQKPFVALGLVSYGFYLWHMPVFYFVRRFDTHWPLWFRVVFAFGLTLGLTLASWFLLERPITRWKERLERQRRPGEMPARALSMAEEPAPSTAPAQPLEPTEGPIEGPTGGPGGGPAAPGTVE